jgi:hypothetical protein
MFTPTYSLKKLAAKINDYDWKSGRNGGTSAALNLRCHRSFFGHSRHLPLS